MKFVLLYVQALYIIAYNVSEKWKYNIIRNMNRLLTHEDIGITRLISGQFYENFRVNALKFQKHDQLIVSYRAWLGNF